MCRCQPPTKGVLGNGDIGVSNIVFRLPSICADGKLANCGISAAPPVGEPGLGEPTTKIALAAGSATGLKNRRRSEAVLEAAAADTGALVEPSADSSSCKTLRALTFLPGGAIEAERRAILNEVFDCPIWFRFRFQTALEKKWLRKAWVLCRCHVGDC